MSKQSPNVYQRLNAVMSEIANVKKEDKKVNGQFRYISFNKVYEDVRPLFIKHGIVNTVHTESYVQDGNMGTLTARVEFINMDNPEDKISGLWVGQGISGNRNGAADDKSIGKALSYLHKNALCKTLILPGSEDEEVDSNAKTEHKRGGKSAARKPQGQPTPQPQPAPQGQPGANPFAPPQPQQPQTQQQFQQGQQTYPTR